jgi:hypothetical protein
MVTGVLDREPRDCFFWLSIAAAFVVALQVNILLIRRGSGHAVVGAHLAQH